MEAVRERIDAAIAGAALHNGRADDLLREANVLVSEACSRGLLPDRPEFRDVMREAMGPLEQYVCERTLAKVTFALAHTAERWWSTPGESLAEAVYTSARMMFDSAFVVRDCKADTPERIAALALAGVEHFNPEADNTDTSIALDLLIVAAEGAADAAWQHPPASGGWIMRLDIEGRTGAARFVFDPDADVPPGGDVFLHEITRDDDDPEDV